eukprot:809675-Karenia_brevis.AAC.1
MMISKCKYPGDHKIGEFLPALRKIIYGSHDSDRYKIDDTPQGKESANMFRDHVYQMLTDKKNPQTMDQDIAMRNAKASAAVNPILYLGGVVPTEKEPKKPRDTKSKGDGKGD